MRLPSYVARLVLVLLFLSLSPTMVRADEVVAAAPTSTTSSVGLASLHKVLGLVKTEFKDPVPTQTLVQGALTGMHTYLVEHRLNASDALVPSRPDGLTTQSLDASFHRILTLHKDITSSSLTEAAIRGMLATLQDPYTVYMDKREYGGLMETMNGGNFGGLGIYIEQDDKHDKRLTIIEPMDDSPAEKAGILPGDVIVNIDGVSAEHMSIEDASKRLRGQEGTPVTLTILRDVNQFDVTMNRAHIQMKTASYKILDGNIGYARLRVFGDDTSAELEDALRAFDQAHVQGYILDLRNNGGGYINTALEVCSKFLPTGSRVVSVVERGSPEAVYVSLPNVRPARPLVVLVNKYSASASEITAGAIQDLHAGTLMGTKTFGKGSVQKIFPLEEGTAVKITTAHYHTPSGRDIHKIGIDPEVVLDMDPHNVGTDQDKQLTQATTFLQTAIAKEAHPEASLQPVQVASVGEVIPVTDPAQEYDFVASHPCEKDGSSLMIVSQKTVQIDGHYYDRVVARSAATGYEQVFTFDLKSVLGQH